MAVYLHVSSLKLFNRFK